MAPGPVWTGGKSRPHRDSIPDRPARNQWSSPEGSRKLVFPDYMTTAQDGGKVVSPTHRSPLYTGDAPGTHLLLVAVSTPGPQCDRKDYVKEKFQ